MVEESAAVEVEIGDFRRNIEGVGVMTSEGMEPESKMILQSVSPLAGQGAKVWMLTCRRVAASVLCNRE